MTTQRIAIIGGGPGGLMLALLLQRNGIDVTVYERHFLNHYEQGGSLDLHEQTGQLALQAAKLHDAFLQKARFEGEDFRLFDQYATLYLDETVAQNEQGTRPEIDRGDLRELLLQAIDPTCMQYGYKLLQCVPLEDRRIALHFENG